MRDENYDKTLNQILTLIVYVDKSANDANGHIPDHFAAETSQTIYMFYLILSQCFLNA